MPDLSHELELQSLGYQIVAGIDEAGRGPLAGPVSVAAVVLPQGFSHPVLNDSKQLKEHQREKLYAELTADPQVSWHCVLLSAADIDTMNILAATHEGMRRAVAGLPVKANAVLIDGRPVKHFPLFQRALVKGDQISYSIAAASVIAKVTRDRWMVALSKRYQGYGFEIHKGYGTAKHLEALRRLGPCPEHRRCFAPVTELLKQGELPL